MLAQILSMLEKVRKSSILLKQSDFCKQSGKTICYSNRAVKVSNSGGFLSLLWRHNISLFNNTNTNSVNYDSYITSTTELVFE